MRIVRRSIKNPGVIYTGRVGAKLRPRKIHRRPGILKAIVYLEGGPLHGSKVKLEKNGDMRTLPIMCRGRIGQYVKGNWIDAS